MAAFDIIAADFVKLYTRFLILMSCVRILWHGRLGAFNENVQSRVGVVMNLCACAFV